MNDRASGPMLNRPYLAFSLDTPEEMARRRFQEKYGFEPPEIHRHKGLLWLGPIDGNGRGPQAQAQPERPAGLLRRAEA
ncbi:MAG: hypothetical protein N2556_06240, partial [Anaerolineae bacterium]|nr:hypothetical protein [Anaerolineae bacterium]